MPVVSVVIAAYNASSFIGETLDSVVAQTLVDIEIIVVDDGSTDSTPDIVRSYAEKDARISLIQQQNSYAGAARNKGMDAASGSYLYFLDADDWIEPNALEILVMAAQKYRCDIVAARSESFDNVSQETSLMHWAIANTPFNQVLAPTDFASRLFQNFVGWAWDKLFDASFVAKTGLRFQGLRTTNDAFFVFCAMAEASSIVCLEDVLFHHRVNNPNSLEKTRSRSWGNAVEAMRAIRDRIQTMPHVEPLLESYYNWILLYTYQCINDLPDDEAAEGYLDTVGKLIDEMPESVSCIGGHERRLLELHAKPRARLLCEAVTFGDELEWARGDAAALQGEIDRLRDAEERLRAEVAQLRGELDAKQGIIDERDAELAEVYGSWRYRIGSVVVAPAQLIPGRKSE